MYHHLERENRVKRDSVKRDYIVVQSQTLPHTRGKMIFSCFLGFLLILFFWLGSLAWECVRLFKCQWQLYLTSHPTVRRIDRHVQQLDKMVNFIYHLFLPYGLTYSYSWFPPETLKHLYLMIKDLIDDSNSFKSDRCLIWKLILFNMALSVNS